MTLDPEDKKLDDFVLHDSQNFEDNYVLHEELGSGKFGTVYRCRNRDNGGIWAAKIIKTIRSKERDAVEKELKIMSCLKHRTLLRCMEAYQTRRKTTMVMECITGGELFERITGDDIPLTERDCVSFMRQICTGVDHMHRNNILHLDLKPENIMCLDHTGYDIKIIDFGFAEHFQDGDQLKVLFGTPEFVAPEIARYEDIGFGTDMWAVGVICYTLLSGLSPFMGHDDVETLSNVTRGSWDFEDEAFINISDDAKHFIEKILVFRKEERLSAKDCLDHPWLASSDLTNGQPASPQLSTGRLKKFIARRRWQRTTNAVRAIGRMSGMRLATQQKRMSAPAAPDYLTYHDSQTNDEESSSNSVEETKDIKPVGQTTNTKSRASNKSRHSMPSLPVVTNSTSSPSPIPNCQENSQLPNTPITDENQGEQFPLNAGERSKESLRNSYVCRDKQMTPAFPGNDRNNNTH